MLFYIKVISLSVFAYLMGSVPWGLILTKAFASADIRKHGSGNIGATNVRRTAGWKLGLATLAADMAKGALPVGIAVLITGSHIYISAVALCAFSGHLYPVFLKFRDGGKGVATAAGCFMIISPLSFFAALSVFVIGVFLSSRVSVGSLSAAIVLPAAVRILTGSDILSGCAFLMTLLICFRHKDNIRRIFSGTVPII